MFKGVGAHGADSFIVGTIAGVQTTVVSSPPYRANYLLRYVVITISIHPGFL